MEKDCGDCNLRHIIENCEDLECQKKRKVGGSSRRSSEEKIPGGGRRNSESGREHLEEVAVDLLRGMASPVNPGMEKNSSVHYSRRNCGEKLTGCGRRRSCERSSEQSEGMASPVKPGMEKNFDDAEVQCPETQYSKRKCERSSEQSEEEVEVDLLRGMALPLNPGMENNSSVQCSRRSSGEKLPGCDRRSGERSREQLDEVSVDLLREVQCPETQYSRRISQELIELIEMCWNCKDCGEKLQMMMMRDCQECGTGIGEEELFLTLLGYDVEALFPSMMSENTGKIIRKMVLKSNIQIHGFDWQQGARYLVLNKHLTGDFSPIWNLLPWTKSGATLSMKNKNLKKRI